mgnify:CR=1 FL=1
MKDKKAKIKIEFQAENDDDLLVAVNYIRFALCTITGKVDVTATVDIPKKFLP